MYSVATTYRKVFSLYDQKKKKTTLLHPYKRFTYINNKYQPSACEARAPRVPTYRKSKTIRFTFVKELQH